jgi:hypothetical protein
MITVDSDGCDLPSSNRPATPWKASVVPEISRFLGIVIAMYYRDHVPAHFHAIYGEFEITVQIDSGTIEGRFPRRALAHVQEWRQLHRVELLEAWRLAWSGVPLPKIEPLE